MEADKQRNLIISWETIVYAFIILVAMMLRLYQLGAHPVQADESSLALSSWQMINGQSPENWEEPLVVGVTSGIFFLFGDNDLAARLIPALLGTALVLMPWFLRGIIGKSGAVITALLLAFSPSFIYFSRSLSGHISVAVLSLLLAVFLLRFARGMNSVLPLAIIVALLLCSGAMGFNIIILFALSLATMFALDRRPAELRKVFQTAWSGRQSLAVYSLFSLGLFLSISTGAFTHLERLGLPSLTAWLKAFDLSRDGEPWYWHLQMIVIYDPLIIIFGLIGAGYTLFRRRKDSAERSNLQMFLVFWAGVSLVLLALIGRKEAGQILSPLLPFTLLAGSLIGELTRRLSGRSLNKAVIPPQRERRTPFVIVPLLGLGLIYSIHTTWSVSYKPGAMELLAPCATSPQVLEMAQAVEDISKGLPDPKAKVAVQSSIGQPFAWYLRHHGNVDYVSKLTPEAPMIIARPDEQTYKQLSGYTIRLRGDLCTEWSRSPFSFRDFWHWLVYREGWGDQRQVSVALYLRR